MDRELDRARRKKAKPADADHGPEQGTRVRFVMERLRFLLARAVVRLIVEARRIEEQCAAYGNTNDTRARKAPAVLRMPLIACAEIVFLALVADSNLPLLLEALGSVDAELARVHYALRDFAAWPTPDSPDLGRTRAALRRAFTGLRTLREQLVVHHTDSPDARASALRARGIVLMLQLVQLRAGIAPLDFGATSFGTVEAFSAYVLATVGRANTLWVGRGLDSKALADAESMFLEIGRDPRVVDVLGRGALSHDLHARLTCCTIAALLAAEVPHVPGRRSPFRQTEAKECQR